MRSINCLPAIFVMALVAVQASGQETRKMDFLLGNRGSQLKIDVEYHDPGEIDILKGSRVLPVRLSATNTSFQPVTLNYSDFRLSLNGSQSLSPVEPEVIADEIRKTGKYPKLLSFLNSQSSVFHRNALESRRLKDGAIKPKGNKDGFVFFMRPEQPNPPFNGVMWLDTNGYEPQALETKDVTVKTASKPNTMDAIRRLWESIVSGELPYKKSYALVIGIGNYKYLPPLSSPAQDTKKMQDFLLAQGFDEVMTIKDESVTSEMFQSPEKYFSGKIQPDDRFLFYYSGHGVSVTEGGRPRGYLPLINEQPGSHGDSIAMDSLVSWMKHLKSKYLLVIMDACFSGLAVGGEVKGIDRVMLNSLAIGPARYLMMAGTENQVSLADSKWNGSLFTEMIIRGVKTAKFADKQDEKIVPTHALYAWLRPAVSSEALKVNRQLTPLLKDLEDVSKGEFVFFRQ